MVGKKSCFDYEMVRLRKTCQNWDTFFALLDSTGDYDIVEHSRKINSVCVKDPKLQLGGMKVLGRLMDARGMAEEGDERVYNDSSITLGQSFFSCRRKFGM
ncbi:hypothetical protein RQL66_011410 [Citrobacter freundii]|uniref:hypothetical protein n=1 Tax=Citrobacter freundii TaxID=546 RepID=UPI00313CDB6E